MRREGLKNPARSVYFDGGGENKMRPCYAAVSQPGWSDSRRLFNVLLTTSLWLAAVAAVRVIARTYCLRDNRCSSPWHVFFCNRVRASPHATRKKLLLHAHAWVSTAVVCLMTGTVIALSNEADGATTRGVDEIRPVSAVYF